MTKRIDYGPRDANEYHLIIIVEVKTSVKSSFTPNEVEKAQKVATVRGCEIKNVVTIGETLALMEVELKDLALVQLLGMVQDRRLLDIQHNFTDLYQFLNRVSDEVGRQNENRLF